MKVKAVFINKPGEVETRWVDYPHKKENEVLIKVDAAGICGSDIGASSTAWHIRHAVLFTDKLSRRQSFSHSVNVPAIPHKRCQHQTGALHPLSLYVVC